MQNEPTQTFGDMVAADILRAREGCLKAIERLIRFCELILLAGAFQFAATKTKDGILTLLAFLLSCAATIYVSEYYLWLSRDWTFERWGKWKWVVSVVVFGFIGWSVYQASLQISHAIEVLANSSFSVPS